VNDYGFQEVEPQFLAVMPSIARVYQKLDHNDPYGKRLYAASPIEIPCFMETRQEQVYNNANEDNKSATGLLYLGWVVPWLSSQDKLDVQDLSAGTGWKTTIISAVVAKSGPDGIHHQEIYYGERGASNRGGG
jgi:hypothetical protein